MWSLILKPSGLETRKGEEPGNTSALGWRGQTWRGAGRLSGKVAVCEWGVLSGIVLSGGESPLQGEGPDGSTRPAKETHAGHVGSGEHEPTSLRGLATGDLLEPVMNRAEASTTEEPDAGKLHVRVCAGGAR